MGVLVTFISSSPSFGECTDGDSVTGERCTWLSREGNG